MSFIKICKYIFHSAAYLLLSNSKYSCQCIFDLFIKFYVQMYVHTSGLSYINCLDLHQVYTSLKWVMYIYAHGHWRCIVHYRANIPGQTSWAETIHVQTLNTVQKSPIHQVTTMLATSKTVLFPGHITTCYQLVLMTRHFYHRLSASHNISLQMNASNILIIGLWSALECQYIYIQYSTGISSTSISDLYISVLPGIVERAMGWCSIWLSEE